MVNFELYFERRERNPLRKRELEQQNIDNYAYVQQQKEKLPKEKLAQIRKMKKLGVEPERIETFRQAKLAEREKELKKQHFRTKLEKPVLIGYIEGIKIYKDKYTTVDLRPGSEHSKEILQNVQRLVTEFKDILPNKKPTIIVSDGSKNPAMQTKGRLGTTNFKAAGIYFDRKIYIDENHTGDMRVLLHEYAHYIAGRIPREMEPILAEEYKKMLNEYFGKETKHKSLQGKHNKQHRIAMAKKLGIPSPDDDPNAYAATNFHEWFAEIMANWRKISTTPQGYRFKQAVKRVLTMV
jgi:hypothetical protein